MALSLGLREPFETFTNNRMEPNGDVSADVLPATMQVDYIRVWERKG